MSLITRMYVRARECARAAAKGQTMTEYALILAAVAVVVFVAYKAMGNQINTVVSSVTTDLKTVR